MRNKSIVNGGGATVKVVPASGVGSCCVIVTETGVDVRDVTINTRGSDTHPGTNSKFTNVILYAPDGEVHIRSNTVATNLEVVAQTIILEPIQMAIDQQVFCGCFTKATKNNSTVTLSDGIQLDRADAFFLKATCDPTGCPGAGCFEAPASGNATTVVLDTAAIPAGTYHVIARFVGSGSYCSEETITLP